MPLLDVEKRCAPSVDEAQSTEYPPATCTGKTPLSAKLTGAAQGPLPPARVPNPRPAGGETTDGKKDRQKQEPAPAPGRQPFLLPPPLVRAPNKPKWSSTSRSSIHLPPAFAFPFPSFSVLLPVSVLPPPPQLRKLVCSPLPSASPLSSCPSPIDRNSSLLFEDRASTAKGEAQIHLPTCPGIYLGTYS